jgi:hypothetical protein
VAAIEHMYFPAAASAEPHSDLCCPSQFWLIHSPGEPLQHRILILPSHFSEILATLVHYLELSPEYAISVHHNFEGTVPFVYLPSPLKDLSNTLKFHPFTPTISYSNHTMSLPVWVIANHSPAHLQTFHPSFELPKQFRDRELPARIGLQMAIRLVDIGMSTEHSNLWIYPDYRVVGSLGL